MKRSTERILTTHVGSLVRPQALQQRSLGPETRNLHVESGRIQTVRDVNELLLGTADIEVVQKLQDSYPISVCEHNAVSGAFHVPTFRWNDSSTDVSVFSKLYGR